MKSDIFVVEVSSRRAYTDGNGNFYHHAIFEKDYERPVGISSVYIDSVRRSASHYVQSDDEIREDVREIALRLGPGRVLFVTHFSTSEGKRSQLANIVAEAARDAGALCFNPSEMLHQWGPEDLFVNEPLLAHYSRQGHKIVQGRYRTYLGKIDDRVKNDSKIALVQQVASNDPGKVAKYGHHGFGDILLGAARLYQLSRIQGRRVEIDWSQFPLAKALNTPDLTPLDNHHRDPLMVFHGAGSKALKLSNRVFTNQRPNLPLDSETQDFLKCWGFTLDPQWVLRVDNRLSSLELNGRDFEVIHVRVGDDSFIEGKRVGGNVPSYLEWIASKLEETAVPTVIISDSVALLTECEARGYLTSGTVPTHSGQTSATSKVSEDQILGFWTDVHLLKGAKRIYQLSSYPWGSGLSKLVAEVFNIPLTPISFASVQTI